MRLLRPWIVLLPLATAVAAAASCGTQGSGASSSTGTSTSHGSGAAPSAVSSGSTASGGTGGTCASPRESFGVCLGGKPPDGGGAGKPGEACTTDSDCTVVCCLCPEGQDRYAYGACKCGHCSSVCDPSNDYRAPVCLDAGPIVTGCLKCSQILNEAWADGDQLGPLACPGTAATTWNALSGCATGKCGCDGGVMGDNGCVACIENADDAGGCSSELGACQLN